MGLEQAFTTLFDSSGTEIGTGTDPIRIDPTGTTTQPISDGGGSITIDGTVTSNQGTAAAVASAWPILVTDGTDTAAVETSAPGGAAAGLVVRVAGLVATTLARPSGATVATNAMTTASSTILALNTSREGVILWNEGSADVYVKLGATASTASYSFILKKNSYWDAPFPTYTGVIDGITAASTATVLSTEITT